MRSRAFPDAASPHPLVRRVLKSPLPLTAPANAIDEQMAVCEPFISWAAQELDAARGSLTTVTVRWDTLRESLLDILRTSLWAASQKTMVLEQHVAHLTGRAITRQSIRPFLRRWAGLSRVLAECSLTWRTDVLFFLRELTRRLYLVSMTLREREPLGELVSVRPRASTPTSGSPGLLVTFASGTELLFLPRAATARRATQTFLDWLCDQSGEPRITFAPAVLTSRATWIRLTPARCPLEYSGLQRVSSRCGFLMAGLHAIGATCLDPSDLVLNGDELVLLNVDTVMRNDSDDAHDTPDMAESFLLNSALGVGFPGAHGRGDELGDYRPLGQGWRSYEWRDRIVTDSIPPRIVREPVQPPDTGAFTTRDLLAEDLVQGFTRGYRTVLDRFDEIWRSDGPLRRWRRVSSVHTVRNASVYHRMIASIEHPDELRSAACRASTLDRLLAAEPIRVKHSAAVLAAERHALLTRTIPRFSSSPTNRHLRLPDGTLVRNYFRRTGMQCTKARMSAMCEADLHRQRLALHNMWAPHRVQVTPPIEHATLASQSGDLSNRFDASTAGEFLDAAVKLGNQLSGTVLQSGSHANWFGLQQDDWGRCRVRPAGPDLYHGLAGIATFLAYLALASGETTFMTLALSAIQSALPKLADSSYWCVFWPGERRLWRAAPGRGRRE